VSRQLGATVLGGDVQRFQTKAHYAADVIRAAIRSGELGPGERIDIETLAVSLGMSATPLREALRLVQADGLIEYEPHRGVRVASFPNEQVAELFQLRALLEGAATRMAVERMSRDALSELREIEADRVASLEAGDIPTSRLLNERWHMTLYRIGTTTEFMNEFIARLWNAFPWTTTWRITGRAETSIREHAAILRAIEKGNHELAGRLIEEHVMSNRAAVLKLLGGLEGERGRKIREPRAEAKRGADVESVAGGTKTAK
jgi:DNA-binding GntR family transcriptional regulator